MQLSTFYSQMQAGFAAYERIVEVQEAVPEVYANPGGTVLESVRGEIEFRDVVFGYNENESVLSKFNIHI